ncbi:acetate/propionate family kinase [Acidiphilium sp. PM]|uniref:acetate/propionate family kinase n=1 Tax=Acidiphilium sp. PM TaxID=1043206 RepID=UPI00021454EE|nr:acetate/propionate family kinase [Acidiphilium sp. PM]EGO95828.1 Acetate kinase [Acidiphilium sp. PM]
MSNAVLVLNAGSSSLKFGIFDTEDGQPRRAHGMIERIGEAPHFRGFDAEGRPVTERRWETGAAMTHEDLLGPLLDWADDHLDSDHLVAVGHRIVHGGQNFAVPVRLDEAVIAALAALTPLAPLHQPHNLAAVRAIARLRPNLPQIGCFDTGFHRTMTDVATRLPLPARYHEAGVRRYGFHGISYEYIAHALAAADPARAAGKVIAAHLGNGASACAMLAGRSVESSMGFTALDGLMMGTRPGTLDPGVVLYMVEQEQLDAKAISRCLYSESGLLGVSGEASDMRTLLVSDRPESRLAVDLFCHRAAREIAALTVALGGLETLVFTAGIGEHAAPVRRMICARLAHLGIVLDDASNERHAPVISASASTIEVRVIPTDEEAMIARHTAALLSG